MSIKVIVNTMGVSANTAKNFILPSTVYVGEQIVNSRMVGFLLECENEENAQLQAETMWDASFAAKIIRNTTEEIQYMQELEYLAR